jgi:hypothetical protein
MGESIKIKDVAEQMIRFYGFEPGQDIKIETIGLRPGERLDERLTGSDEVPYPTSENGILIVHKKRPSRHPLPELLEKLRPVCYRDRTAPASYRNAPLLRKILKEAVPTLKHDECVIWAHPAQAPTGLCGGSVTPSIKSHALHRFYTWRDRLRNYRSSAPLQSLAHEPPALREQIAVRYATPLSRNFVWRDQRLAIGQTPAKQGSSRRPAVLPEPNNTLGVLFWAAPIYLELRGDRVRVHHRADPCKPGSSRRPAVLPEPNNTLRVLLWAAPVYLELRKTGLAIGQTLQNRANRGDALRHRNPTTRATVRVRPWTTIPSVLGRAVPRG